MDKPLCIYHGNCADGFAAAWVVWKHFKGNVDFFPGVYQTAPPDVKHRHVIMVDFSYKLGVIQQMAQKAYSITILDHHKTAKADLDGFMRPDLEMFGTDIHKSLLMGGDVFPDVYSLFDMERSGCGITWDFFNPGMPRPKMLDHLEDRDLWRFALPKTREIQASMFSCPYDFDLWDTRINHFEKFADRRTEIITEGEAIERKHLKDINELIEVMTRPMKFLVPGFEPGTFLVPVANLPYTMGSDAAHILCERGQYGEARPLGEVSNPEYYNHPCAGYYYDKPEGRQFGLRSRKGTGTDVGEIAKLYGGGGHENASGFLVPFDRLGEFE